MRRLLSIALSLIVLAGFAAGCEKKPSDPCEKLYFKLSRCKDYTVHASMEADRKAAFLADCRANFAKGDRLGKCLKMDGCASMMIRCRNSQDKPRGKDVRKLFDESAKQLGGN